MTLMHRASVAMLARMVLICVVASGCLAPCITEDVTRIIKVGVRGPPLGSLSHFWTSTGFCPPDPHQKAYQFMLGPDMRMNLALISSLPGDGISHVRMHWLLDLITREQSRYNFEHLDSLLDWMNDLKMKPGFELMGNPSNWFSDFEDSKQVEEWKKLVLILASRYIGRYGLDYVKDWRFETWNEPDHHDFDGLNFTQEGFVNYYDACVTALSSVHPSLQLGSPAGSCHLDRSPLCWHLLEHCDGLPDVMKPTFISFHKKGQMEVQSIIQKELDTTERIRLLYPNLRHVPVVNDEADPLVGWSRPHDWRADVRYASLVALSVILHQQQIIRKNISLAFISNDNGFLSYHPFHFEQRTLLARFQMNLTKPSHVQFIRKPVFASMALLSMMGNKELQVTIRPDPGSMQVMATQHPDGWTILLVRNDGVRNDSGDIVKTRLILQGCSAEMYGSVTYAIDGRWNDPWREWKAMGKPAFPSRGQLARLRKLEGPRRVSMVQKMKRCKWNLRLSLPSVWTVVVCKKGPDPPGQVSGLIAINVTFNDVLLLWDDAHVSTRCIQTYIVEHSVRQTGEFRRVNRHPVIYTSYQRTILKGGTSWQEKVRGLYRIIAQDFWGRMGPPSKTISY